LELKVDMFEAEPRHMARVAQLVNKTNQFNLTTRRRTLDQLEELRVSKSAHVFAIVVSDRFGEYGLVGVAITCLNHKKQWLIDTLLISCRVLGRNVETAFLAGLAKAARSMGADTLHGQYLSSSKNALVENFYETHGFTYDHESQVWTADIENIKRPPDHVATSLRFGD
jgi:FkbH-like protein